MAIIKLNHSGVHGAVSKPCVYGLSFIGLRRRVFGVCIFRFLPFVGLSWARFRFGVRRIERTLRRCPTEETSSILATAVDSHYETTIEEVDPDGSFPRTKLKAAASVVQSKVHSDSIVSNFPLSMRILSRAILEPAT